MLLSVSIRVIARVRRRPRLLKIILLRLDKSQLTPRNEAKILR